MSEAEERCGLVGSRNLTVWSERLDCPLKSPLARMRAKQVVALLIALGQALDTVTCKDHALWAELK